MIRRLGLACFVSCGLLGCASSAPIDVASAKAQVIATERAFAKTMADRDFAAFSRFVADDAVFFDSPGVLRGKAQVIASWRHLFDGAAAPFSWEPDEVDVLDSATLALSSGPVRDRTGKLVARFTSVWRRDANGEWHIVFDRGDAAAAK